MSTPQHSPMRPKKALWEGLEVNIAEGVGTPAGLLIEYGVKGDGRFSDPGVDGGTFTMWGEDWNDGGNGDKTGLACRLKACSYVPYNQSSKIHNVLQKYRDIHQQGICEMFANGNPQHFFFEHIAGSGPNFCTPADNKCGITEITSSLLKSTLLDKDFDMEKGEWTSTCFTGNKPISCYFPTALEKQVTDPNEPWKFKDHPKTWRKFRVINGFTNPQPLLKEGGEHAKHHQNRRRVTSGAVRALGLSCVLFFLFL